MIANEYKPNNEKKSDISNTPSYSKTSEVYRKISNNNQSVHKIFPIIESLDDDEQVYESIY